VLKLVTGLKQSGLTFVAEIKEQGVLYAMEAVLPMWAMRLIPAPILDAGEWLVARFGWGPFRAR